MFGIGFYYLVHSLFKLEVDWHNGFSGLGAKGWLLLIGSIVIGFYGMGLGWKIAIQIKVRNNNVHYLLLSIWHFLANGSILWIAIWILYLTKKMGKEGGKAFIKDFGYTPFALYIISTGIVASILSVLILLAFRQLKPGVKPKILPSFVLTSPVTIVAGYVFISLLKISSYAWFLIGILTPVPLVWFSVYMIERDIFDMQKFRRMIP